MCHITAALNTIDKTVQLNSDNVQSTINMVLSLSVIFSKYALLIEQVVSFLFIPPLLSNSLYTNFLMENVCSYSFNKSVIYWYAQNLIVVEP